MGRLVNNFWTNDIMKFIERLKRVLLTVMIILGSAVAYSQEQTDIIDIPIQMNIL